MVDRWAHGRPVAPVPGRRHQSSQPRHGLVERRRHSAGRGSQQGERSPCSFTDGEKRDRGVGRPSRTIEIGTPTRWVHLHQIVCRAEGVFRHRAWTHKPATIEDMFRSLDLPDGEFGRPQQVGRTANTIGDSSGHKRLVVRELLKQRYKTLITSPTECRRCGVGVGRCDQDLLWRNARL